MVSNSSNRLANTEGMEWIQLFTQKEVGWISNKCCSGDGPYTNQHRHTHTHTHTVKCIISLNYPQSASVLTLIVSKYPICDCAFEQKLNERWTLISISITIPLVWIILGRTKANVLFFYTRNWWFDFHGTSACCGWKENGRSFADYSNGNVIDPWRSLETHSDRVSDLMPGTLVVLSLLLQSREQHVSMANVQMIKDIHVVECPGGKEISRWRRNKNLPMTRWRWSMTIDGVQGTTVKEKRLRLVPLSVSLQYVGAKTWPLSACQAESQWDPPNKRRAMLKMQHGGTRRRGGRRGLAAKWEDAVSERSYDTTQQGMEATLLPDAQSNESEVIARREKGPLFPRADFVYMLGNWLHLCTCLWFQLKLILCG